MIKHRLLRRKAALPVLLEARPDSVKATGHFLEGAGPESGWPEELATRPLSAFGRCGFM